MVIPGAMNCPARMDSSSFFFQSKSPFELIMRPVLLIGRGTFKATSSLPSERMMLMRDSGVIGFFVSACAQDPEISKIPRREAGLKTLEFIACLVQDCMINVRLRPSSQIGQIWYSIAPVGTKESDDTGRTKSLVTLT